MKFTQVLYKQHIGRQITKLWYIKRERKILSDKIENYLSDKLGIQVKDALEVITPKQNHTRYFKKNSIFFTNYRYYMYRVYLISIAQTVFYIRLEIEGLAPRIFFDKTHPDWKAQACLIFKDHNVLQEGFRQAQILTNTVCLPDNSSNYIQDSLLDLPEYVDDIVKRYIKFSFF